MIAELGLEVCTRRCNAFPLVVINKKRHAIPQPNAVSVLISVTIRLDLGLVQGAINCIYLCKGHYMAPPFPPRTSAKEC